MEIVLYPHPALRWKSKPITQIDADLRRTVAEMFELMYEANGVGLAANQVGLPYRLFIANPSGEQDEKDQEFVFINPEITSRKGTVEGEEGCLSLPELYGPVRRAKSIVVDAFDLSGNSFALELDELPSRVVQHENDHIDGVMFIDRMTDAAKRERAARIEEFEEVFRSQQSTREIPSDDELLKQLKALEPK